MEILQTDLRNKKASLNEGKYVLQGLIALASQKESEVSQNQTIQNQLKNSIQITESQKERLEIQLISCKDQINKKVQQILLTNKQIEEKSEITYKTQSYIRELKKEFVGLNDRIDLIQSENQLIDKNTSEQRLLSEMKASQVLKLEQDCQQNQLEINLKELEIQKVKKQIIEKVKALALQKEKWRTMVEQFDEKRYNCQQLQDSLQNSCEEINSLRAKNQQINQINEQLKFDLEVCQKHLQNVIKMNKNVETSMAQFKEMNLLTIKKLHEPLKEKNECDNLMMTGKLSFSSRTTAFGSGFGF